MIDPNSRVRVLTEALPYIQQFQGAVIVVKYGGKAMVEEALMRGFARDVVLLKAVGMHPVVIHGGGPRISARLEQRGLSCSFVHGIRVTGRRAMEVVAEVLDEINAEISGAIRDQGGKAESLVVERGVICAKKIEQPGNEIDFGFTGSVDSVSEELGALAVSAAKIPVLVPAGIGKDGLPYNINADSSAAGVAKTLKARKLVLLTDTIGVLDESGELITHITAQRVAELIDSGVVRAGMLPKVQCAFAAVRAGVGAAHIIDGRVRHALLLELLTDSGVGTLIAG